MPLGLAITDVYVVNERALDAVSVTITTPPFLCPELLLIDAFANVTALEPANSATSPDIVIVGLMRISTGTGTEILTLVVLLR